MILEISVLVDNPNSWIIPFAKKLTKLLKQRGHLVQLLHRAEQISFGDIAVFLSCENIIPRNILKRNKHNIIPHSSNLPRGKGWSPLTWQVLEGKNKIIDILFEAHHKADSGDIYFQEEMRFNGNELLDEMRKIQGETDIRLVLKFIDSYPNVLAASQKGQSTYYRRRRPEDSMLDLKKPIEKQFNLFRVVDNERYPAYFNFKGETYILKIYKLKKHKKHRAIIHKVPTSVKNLTSTS